MHTPRLRYIIALAGVAALCLIFWLFWPREKATRTPERNAIRAKPLASYRKDFPRSDGTLRGDEELAAVLTAKGIPFTADNSAEKGLRSSAGLLPPVQYESARLTNTEKEQIELILSDVLPAQLDQLRATVHDLELGRLVVNTQLKLELHFNAAFTRIADDESRLTDFSESLHSLGSTALKGNTIYIDGKPLGVYLHERDRVRDNEAKAASPAAAGDGRR